MHFANCVTFAAV